MKKNEIVYNLVSILLLVKERAPVNESENIELFLSEIERVEFYPTMCRMYQFRVSTKIAIEIARLFRSSFRRIVCYSQDLISFREILVERINLDFLVRLWMDPPRQLVRCVNSKSRMNHNRSHVL